MISASLAVSQVLGEEGDKCWEGDKLTWRHSRKHQECAYSGRLHTCCCLSCGQHVMPAGNMICWCMTDSKGMGPVLDLELHIFECCMHAVQGKR